MRFKLVLVLGSFLLLLAPDFIAAQSASFNVRGGLNLSNQSFDGPRFQNSSGDMTTGFHIGAFAELSFSERFGLETGLLLQSKGFKGEFSYFDEDVMDTLSGDQTTSLLYLDVPILFKTRFPLGGVNLIASAGPYFGFGLSGTRFFEWQKEGEPREQETTIDWGDNGDFKSVDYGVMATVGIEFSNVFLAASYAHGLANISTIEPQANTIRHQNIMISIGFRLGAED